ncbi:MAG: SRPBCC family protein [Bacteroidota bacterium]|nr:SRPBCC family protein [Bacteroidota bacterium]
MKALKYFASGLLVLIIIVLFVALFVPKEFDFEKSITINAPIDTVWEHVNSLSALDKWSPWNDYDPEMKKSLTGRDGTVGAMQNWESNIVGSGSQSITNIDKPSLFETELKFYKPHKSQGKAYIKLVYEGRLTKVTWGMTTRMPYPMNIMILFINVEKSMGKDWNKGLLKLKEQSEK